MKNLMRLRAQGTEPELIAVNLTGKPVEYPKAYIAEPDGSIKSLYAANVVVLCGDDADNFYRSVLAANKIFRLGVSSLEIYCADFMRWTRDAEGGWNLIEDKEPNSEKMYGIYSNSDLEIYAGDDWDEIKNSDELKNTFAYLLNSNHEVVRV